MKLYSIARLPTARAVVAGNITRRLDLAGRMVFVWNCSVFGDRNSNEELCDRFKIALMTMHGPLPGFSEA